MSRRRRRAPAQRDAGGGVQGVVVPRRGPPETVRVSLDPKASVFTAEGRKLLPWMVCPLNGEGEQRTLMALDDAWSADDLAPCLNTHLPPPFGDCVYVSERPVFVTLNFRVDLTVVCGRTVTLVPESLLDTPVTRVTGFVAPGG